MLTREPCPGCGAPARIPVGTPYVGTVGLLWRKRSFEERLYRCAEGHVYSVRLERGAGGESVETEVWDGVEEWLERRTGAAALERPPQL